MEFDFDDANTSDADIYFYVKIDADWTPTTVSNVTTFSKNVTGKTYGLSFVLDSSWTAVPNQSNLYYQVKPAADYAYDGTQLDIIASVDGNIGVKVSDQLSTTDFTSFTNIDLDFVGYAIQSTGADGETAETLWTGAAFPAQ